MTFEQKWAEFVQRNPALARPDEYSVVLTLCQFKQACRRFFVAGAESMDKNVDSELGNVMRQIFGG